MPQMRCRCRYRRADAVFLENYLLNLVLSNVKNFYLYIPFASKPGCMPKIRQWCPWGLYYVGALLKHHGYDVAVFQLA